MGTVSVSFKRRSVDGIQLLPLSKEARAPSADSAARGAILGCVDAGKSTLEEELLEVFLLLSPAKTGCRDWVTDARFSKASNALSPLKSCHAPEENPIYIAPFPPPAYIYMLKFSEFSGLTSCYGMHSGAESVLL